MFNNKRRINSAFAKGLMLGKAVKARDERDRLVALLQDRHESILDYLGLDQHAFTKADYLVEILETIKAGKND